jgi:hypothetical protein
MTRTIPMNLRQVLFIGAISIFAGAFAGLITKAWVTWIGITVITFALLLASAPWINRKFSRNPQRVQAEATDVAQDLIERRTAEGYNPNMSEVGPKTASSNIISDFSTKFNISEEKARSLYDAGYRRWGDLHETIPEDLMMVPGINPTIARRIVGVVGQERQQNDDN